MAARAALAKVAVVVDPPLPDEDGYETARAAAEAARAEVSAVQARLESARAERDRARVAVERSGHLTGEADCPLCGQALGDAFEAVQAHRAEELVEAEGNLVEAGSTGAGPGRPPPPPPRPPARWPPSSGPHGRRGAASRRRGPGGPRRKRRWSGPRPPTAGRWPPTRPRC